MNGVTHSTDNRKRDGKDEQPYGFTGKSGNLTDFSRLAGNRQVIHQYLERKREL